MPAPANYVQHTSGYWYNIVDQSGPYTFDGTTMALASPSVITSGTADTGGSVKVGGVYSATPPTLTDGQRGNAQLDARGNVKMGLYTADSPTPISSGASADALSAAAVRLRVDAVPALFNGTTTDRQRGNVDTGALITHTAASTGATGADQTNFNGRGVKVVIDITAITGTSPTLTVTIQGRDAASGKYYTLLASTALNVSGTTVLEVYPGLPTAANSTANATLPRTWRVISVIGGTGPAVTATVGASVIV